MQIIEKDYHDDENIKYNKQLLKSVVKNLHKINELFECYQSDKEITTLLQYSLDNLKGYEIMFQIL